MSAFGPKRTWPTAQRIGLKTYPAPSPYDAFVLGLGVGDQNARVHYVCWLGDDAMAIELGGEPDLAKRVEQAYLGQK